MDGNLMAVFALCMLMHPGHSTRVELQYNSANMTFEMAMRIDHADLESALRKRADLLASADTTSTRAASARPWVLEEINDAQAKELVGEYLRETLRVNGARIDRARFQWIGWERKRSSTWIYAELKLDQQNVDDGQAALSILTLYETEPELNHVVAVRQPASEGDQKSGVDKVKSMVLSKQKSTVTIVFKDREPIRTGPDS